MARKPIDNETADIKNLDELKAFAEKHVPGYKGFNETQLVRVARVIAQAEGLVVATGIKAEKAEQPFSVEVGEYKGNPTLCITGNHRPLYLGKEKALTLLNNWKAVSKAIKENFCK
jgi:hypothetical protein